MAKATLNMYKWEVARFSKLRNDHKERIQRLAKTIKNFSPHSGKLVVRGNVPLKVFFGGKHPAKLEVEYRQGRQKIR